MSNSKSTKIFISHSSVDTNVGEKFLDALVSLGINKDEVFYSSLYLTGVALGNNIHLAVKKALSESELVIFLLTRSFYQSEYCLNEMGAVWANDKKFIPILLDNLSPNDMKGFIDKNYVALFPKKDKICNLVTELRKYMPLDSDDTVITSEFEDFIRCADEMVGRNHRSISLAPDELSEIEKMIIAKKLTDSEVIVLDYFMKADTFEIFDGYEYDYSLQRATETKEGVVFRKHAEKYNIDLYKAKRLLEKSGYLTLNYGDVNGDWGMLGEYTGCELDMKTFRDLMGMSVNTREVIEKVLSSRLVVSVIDSSSHEEEENTIECIVFSNDFREIEALLFRYLIDFAKTTLGDRWMAEVEINKIIKWEEQNNLKNTLSSNYEIALNIVKAQELVEIASETSYGNPREYRLKREYGKQLLNLKGRAKDKLSQVIESNKQEDNEFDL